MNKIRIQPETLAHEYSCSTWGHIPEPVIERDRAVAMRCSHCRKRLVSEGTLEQQWGIKG